MDEAKHKPRYPWYVRMVVGRNPIYTLFRAAIWATFLIVMFKVVFIGVRVKGQSMEPNFHEGQIKVINRLSYLRHPPQRGDVVAFRMYEFNALVLKRVVGLPGETVSFHRGEIYINGKRLEEPYATKGRTSAREPRVLEPTQYFLIGDNRDVTDWYWKYDYQIVGKLLF